MKYAAATPGFTTPVAFGHGDTPPQAAPALHPPANNPPAATPAIGSPAGPGGASPSPAVGSSGATPFNARAFLGNLGNSVGQAFNRSGASNMLNSAMRTGLPPGYDRAMHLYNQANDPNLSLASGERWNAANELTQWMNTNQNNPVIANLRNNPQVQEQMRTVQGPIGQIASTVLPHVNNMTRDPASFSKLLAIPGIKELFEGTIGNMGAPGLAMSHGFLSGNMRNWNALTAGLRDPSQRLPGRNMYSEISGAMPSLGQLFGGGT